MASITQDYSEALGKQVFAKEFILNGLFPCQSDIVKMIELAKVDWKFNDKFEYRMLFSNTNSGNTINTQTFDSNFNLRHPGQLEYGVFQATYGALMDGFNIDMTKQLETRESRAAFNKEYATRLHSMRINVASLFKNLVINGRYGVAHRVMPPLSLEANGGFVDSNGRPSYKYGVEIGTPDDKGNYTWVQASFDAGTSGTGVNGYYDLSIMQRSPNGNWAPQIRMVVPINVYHSDFKTGRLLGRARKERKDPVVNASWVTGLGSKMAPWGKSYVSDCWVVTDNQPKVLTLAYIGDTLPTGTNSDDLGKLLVGEYFELFGNRKTKMSYFTDDFKLKRNSAGSDFYNGMYADAGGDFVGADSDPRRWTWTSGGFKTDEAYCFSEATGGMEGLADLFPWYTALGEKDFNQANARLGLNRFFRGQRDRLRYTTEQAGLFMLQQENQSIMDCLLEAVEVAKGTVPWEDMVIWINPTTLTSIGMYEQVTGAGPKSPGMQVFKDVQLDSKLIYQRGITAISFRVGNQIIPNVVSDYNLPTDVILIAPLKDIAYNCWDNAAFQMNQYIQETFSKSKPPAIKDLTVPREFTTKLDLSARITYGSPVAGDLSMMNPGVGETFGYNGFIHPSNSLPVAYHEMGSLFTPNPYAYTVVKLRNQIINPSDTCMDWWDLAQGSNSGYYPGFGVTVNP